jgi:hypothetical protein
VPEEGGLPTELIVAIAVGFLSCAMAAAVLFWAKQHEDDVLKVLSRVASSALMPIIFMNFEIADVLSDLFTLLLCWGDDTGVISFEIKIAYSCCYAFAVVPSLVNLRFRFAFLHRQISSVQGDSSWAKFQLAARGVVDLRLNGDRRGSTAGMVGSKDKAVPKPEVELPTYGVDKYGNQSKQTSDTASDRTEWFQAPTNFNDLNTNSSMSSTPRGSTTSSGGEKKMTTTEMIKKKLTKEKKQVDMDGMDQDEVKQLLNAALEFEEETLQGLLKKAKAFRLYMTVTLTRTVMEDFVMLIMNMIVFQAVEQEDDTVLYETVKIALLTGLFLLGFNGANIGKWLVSRKIRRLEKNISAIQQLKKKSMRSSSQVDAKTALLYMSAFVNKDKQGSAVEYKSGSRRLSTEEKEKPSGKAMLMRVAQSRHFTNRNFDLNTLDLVDDNVQMDDASTLMSPLQQEEIMDDALIDAFDTDVQVKTEL